MVNILLTNEEMILQLYQKLYLWQKKVRVCHTYNKLCIVMILLQQQINSNLKKVKLSWINN